jgi:alpha-ketoglutarate-dependent taurine dioxygenase
MKLIYDRNEWTVFIQEDIRDLTETEIRKIAELVNTHSVVAFKDQKLTTTDQLKFCSTFGKVQSYKDKQNFKHLTVDGEILRVTGQKDDTGKTGLFGHPEELGWHCNESSNLKRDPLVWLYSVQGSKGSITSWINLVAAYNDLPKDLKNSFEDKTVVCGWEQGRFGRADDFYSNVEKNRAVHKLIQSNYRGEKAIFFPFNQTYAISGYSKSEYNEIAKFLRYHIEQEKYMYHHFWDDGDAVISDQWLSIHKRWKFDKIEDRILHRIAFDYSKIFN